MKQRLAMFIYADTETFEGLGRVFNALAACQELRAAGDEVRVIFDGAGTKWIPALEDPGHKAHALYQAVKPSVVGACSFCATVFGVADRVRPLARLVDEYDGHPSVRSLLVEGFTVVNY